MENPDRDSTTTGVKADAPPCNTQSMSDRPASARSNRDERLKLLKEKQNEERLRKLEELKEHALLAARLREEQDSRRKKHFELLGRKEDERRRQAEERRRMLDEERKLSLQTKFEMKKAQVPKPNDRKPLFAFGSCTPRLIENNVDGFHWKSQYNLNVTRESTMKSTSAHDLHSQTMEPDRVFCGRRKTDLTPTLPIRRVDCSTRSTSRTGGGSGRIYSSMTRLDNRFPGGQPRTNISTPPSKSKSTTQLASAGKLTRTELLRQALVTSRGSGKESTTSGSVTPSRPPSSMTSSLMTSSIHSQGPAMRPRNLGARKSRPVSVHITGISNGTENVLQPRGEKLNSQSPSSKNDNKVLVKTEKPGRNPHQPGGGPGETSNILASTPPTTVGRIKLEKKAEVKSEPSRKAPVSLKVGPSSNKGEKSPVDTGTIRRAKSASAKSTTTSTVNESSPKEKVIAKPTVTEQKKHEYIKVESVPTNTSPELEPQVLKNLDVEPDLPVNVEIIEPALISHTEVIKVEKAEEELVKAGNTEVISEPEYETKPATEESVFANIQIEDVEETKVEASVLVVSKVDEISEMSQDEQSTIGASGESIDSKAPKIMTEGEARAALAEKRRLARELQEREAAEVEARAEAERLLEEERQRLEIEEAERLAVEAKEHEEERLRIAIEEQEKRAQEERKKLEEEETARLERENYEREAAREAERVRLEMEERLKREEEERLERKRRVEAIMSRTRKKETETAMATTPTPPEETASNDVKSTALNGIQTTLDQSSTRTTINNINNYNNNNDFSETLIDFGDMIQGPPSSTQSNNSSNDIMNSPLQDLLS